MNLADPIRFLRVLPGGGWQVTIADMTEPHVIQGIEAERSIQAWNLTELVDAVRMCAAEGRAIADYGRFHGGLGQAPPRGYCRITGPSGIVEHAAADMTVRVRAGTTLGDLRRDLAEANQWLPVDGPDAMTIGEMVLHHAYGPWRCGFGSVRDLLLGLRFVDARGEELAVGGRTVKNVAGYDVTRLMVGSWGMLGMLTELTLRTYALPPRVTRVTVEGLSPRAIDAELTALIVGDGAPAGLHVEHDSVHMARLQVVYCGQPATCDAQVEAMHRWLGMIESQTQATRCDVILDQYERERECLACDTTLGGLMKLIVPTGRLGDVLETIDWPAGSRRESLPTHGVAWAGGDWSVDKATRLHDALAAMMSEVGGRVVWQRRPSDTDRLPIFAPMPGDAAIMTKIKSVFDPQNVFNPGRMGVSDG